MPLTDSYEWALSNMPQDVMKDEPFSNYQYNYINDIGSGIYNNQSLSLVQYDLSSIFNSGSFSDTRAHMIVTPLIRIAEAFNGNAHVDLPESSFYLTSLKNLNVSIVHQADLILNGKTVHQLQPYTGLHKCIKLASQLSVDDLNLYGSLLGMQKMDNPDSMTFTSPTSLGTDARSKPSIANNYVNGTPTQQSFGGSNVQGIGIANDAIQQKVLLNKYATLESNTTASYQRLNQVSDESKLLAEFQPQFKVVNGVAIWFDYAIIFVKDLLDAMDHIGLTRRMDGILRLYINTGFCSVTCPSAGELRFANVNSTFTDVCPLMINNNRSALPVATATSINAGLFIGSAPNYSFAGATGTSNWSGIASPLRITRYYFTQIVLQPTKALEYLSANQAKTVIYDSVLYNTFTNIKAGGNFSQLVQSGVTNLKNIIIVPFISASVAGFPAYKSPFDPAGSCSGAPCSITNLQVAVGGTNQLATTLYYTYEQFIQQISKYNKQSSSEYGVESGLWSPSFWANNRFYVVAVRSTEDDMNTPRNVTISFVNNCNLDIDILVFCEYSDKLIINCGTGMITK